MAHAAMHEVGWGSNKPNEKSHDDEKRAAVDKQFY
jgi:hypothetical protein